MFMMIYRRLVCCSWPRWTSMAPLVCGENLALSVPENIGGSRAALDTRLPWYTSGFE